MKRITITVFLLLLCVSAHAVIYQGNGYYIIDAAVIGETRIGDDGESRVALQLENGTQLSHPTLKQFKLGDKLTLRVKIIGDKITETEIIKVH